MENRKVSLIQNEFHNGITSASISFSGDRAYNEDTVAESIQEKNSVFVLADGLGGHGNGDVASMTVCESVLDFQLKLGGVLPMQMESALDRYAVMHPSYLDRAFIYAQEKLMEKKQEPEYEHMMTTMVALFVEDDTIQWAHVGDSRLYYFQDGELVKFTFDHSVPQALVLSGDISQDEVRHHPDRNRLLKAMGKEWNERVEYVLDEPVRKVGKQAFLMCSDGFWEHILEEEMQLSLNTSPSVNVWLEEMTAIVKERGKDYRMDNFSAVAVWLE